MHHREHPSKAADRIGGKAGAAKSGQSAPLIGARDSIEMKLPRSFAGGLPTPRLSPHLRGGRSTQATGVRFFGVRGKPASASGREAAFFARC